jgi:hypothetical protein
MLWRGVLLGWLAAVRPAHAAGDATYVGAAVCATCHPQDFARWSGSRHSKMVQPATSTAVKGDFGRGRLVLRGGTYVLREREGVYYITESYLTGKPQEQRVDYTLGNRRIQHYLTTLASGRVIVLPPSWGHRAQAVVSQSYNGPFFLRASRWLRSDTTLDRFDQADNQSGAVAFGASNRQMGPPPPSFQ